MIFGRKRASSPVNASQFLIDPPWNPAPSSQSVLAMCPAVFSCTTKSTVSGNSVLAPLWSQWVWVLMIVVTGLSVMRATSARMSPP